MNDLKNVYSDFLEDARHYIGSLPILAVAGIAYLMGDWILSAIAYRLPEGLNFLFGFARWFYRVATLTHFATLMSQMFLRDRLVWSDLYRYDQVFFPPLTQAFFVVYLVELVLNRFIFPGFGMSSAFSLVMIWTIFTQPIYEIVYIAHETTASLFSSLLDFWRVNIVPLGAFVVVGYVVYQVLFPIHILSMAMVPFSVPFRLGLGILYAVYLFIKAILFRILYFSNPRSRAFHANANRR